MLALERAAGSFHPDREARFGTFAAAAISNALSRAIRRQSRVIRIPETHYRDMAVVRQAMAELSAELGRPPRCEEIAQSCVLTVKCARFSCFAAAGALCGGTCWCNLFVSQFPGMTTTSPRVVCLQAHLHLLRAMGTQQQQGGGSEAAEEYDVVSVALWPCTARALCCLAW